MIGTGMRNVGTIPPMSESTTYGLVLRLWVIRNFRRARTKPMKGRRMSQFKAAVSLGITPHTVGSWEQDRAAPAGDSLARVVAWMEDRLGEKAPDDDAALDGSA